jgi:ribonucleoside-diphosphate reductase alpha chain
MAWTEKATRIAMDKYAMPGEETPQDIIKRVTNTIAEASWKFKHTDGGAQTTEFYEKLYALQDEQKFFFNSPVYFNVGVREDPQCWACLILEVDDNLNEESGIENWWRTESETFRYGSGSGVNLSRLRGSTEALSGGKGVASGPVSFMRPADAIAGTITSGGRTRRAAKMVILDADHPDIEEFIDAKKQAEAVQRYLLEGGFDVGLNGKDSVHVQYQNANNSVRVTDSFMQAVRRDNEWTLVPRTPEGASQTVRAGQLWSQITTAAYECGDPGIQFHDTINRSHTCKSDGEITASNPCSEYMFLGDTVCNLGSLNLLAFYSDGQFDVEGFTAAVEIAITAMDIIVDLSSYPNAKVAAQSKNYRTLGLGYANLGGLLMAAGYAYDSDKGRNLAAAITFLMQGVAYRTSAKLGDSLGAYPRYKANKKGHLEVLEAHYTEGVLRASNEKIISTLWFEGASVWEDLKGKELNALRNAQVTVIAPTGTISLVMDCESSGIEPIIALDATKSLVGGGSISVGGKSFVQSIMDGNGNDDILSPLYATALGTNAVSPEGHVKMMAAVQPFISGGISKTVNLPADSTEEDVDAIYRLAHEAGCKSIAVYRDGSKAFQPVAPTDSSVSPGVQSFSNGKEEGLTLPAVGRKKPAGTRAGITHKFDIGGETFYVTVNYYEDGEPCEVFIKSSKSGSALYGAYDAISIGLSLGLQYGVPIEQFVDKFRHTNFAPQGMVVADSDIKFADSPMDYVVRWLESEQAHSKGVELDINMKGAASEVSVGTDTGVPYYGATCSYCNSVDSMFRSGSCLTCNECGESTGC